MPRQGRKCGRRYCVRHQVLRQGVPVDQRYAACRAGPQSERCRRHRWSHDPAPWLRSQPAQDKRIDQCFGWGKLVGPIRQVLVQGLDEGDHLLR
jgi:hypothetical protein